ncbi:hypothetical protein [Comamonas sp. 26]|uniref:hypothetical protein n=1 Tax=Comamonas sp. 26 TaxID=2035201 RepID=UPI000C198A57|nr:hypothetical protein [Comamonas sp. 26]PIG09444.1 hypothetical protein CLU84_2354 [Comamonas sp. 26]
MSITPESEQGSKPDVLRELYQQAVADDRGPSAQSSAAILARAKQRAAAASQESAKPQSQPAANDRFWLRHALGGLAAVGLVGWLMLQHAAWWDGSDKGIGVEPDARPAVVAEQAAPAPVLSPEPNPAAVDAAQSEAAEVAPITNRATHQSSVVQPSKENRAVAPEDKAPAAMDIEAKVQAPVREQAAPAVANATPPMAAPASSIAPSMERSERMAPTAKARDSSAGEGTPNAAEQSLATADIAPQQNPEVQAKLPLCPLVDEEQGRKPGANGDAQKDDKSAASAALKPPNCRPRKANEKHPVKSEKAPEAMESVANPVQ